MESSILAQAGVQVVIIGILAPRDPLFEEKDGFCIKRVRPRFGIALWFRENVYVPIYRRLPLRFRKLAQSTYRIFAAPLRRLDMSLTNIAIYTRLLKAMLAEKADYYHTHSPLTLLAMTLLAAKVRGRKYVSDFNDILIMHGCSNRENYYEQENAYEPELSERESTRIKSTLSLVPDDVGSIADVGCGDGRITNYLPQHCTRVIGVDISRRALQFIEDDRIGASAAYLPFTDSCFDLVVATELLEHLTKRDYHAAILEIKRVATRYILIGVPLKEQLTIAEARCPRCRIVFHGNYHLRSFSKTTIRKLFSPEFEMTRIEETGTTAATYVPWLLWVRHHLGGIWTRTPKTICPSCGYHLYPGKFPERNALSKFCDETNRRMTKSSRNKSHVVAVYRRTELN